MRFEFLAPTLRARLREPVLATHSRALTQTNVSDTEYLHTMSLMKRWRVLGLCVAGGCSNPFNSGDCTELVRPAITIEVRELGSGRALADSASGIARTATFADSLKPFQTESATGKLVALQAYGPGGIYRVDLQRPGFQPWSRDDIRVTSNRCGDNTVALRADLVATSVAPATRATLTGVVVHDRVPHRRR